MRKTTNSSESRNYSLMRSYNYDSNDKTKYPNQKPTEEEWKKQILEDWSCQKLNAKHVTIIFHDGHKSNDQEQNGLHAHACVNFTESIFQHIALSRSLCSRDKNCTPIPQRMLSNAYKYLLHITEKAIEEGKTIYGEKDLHILVADNVKFDYHQMIAKKSKTSTQSLELSDKQYFEEIRRKIYRGDYFNPQKDNINCFTEIVLEKLKEDDRLGEIIALNRNYYQKILDAIATGKINAQQAQNGKKAKW